MDKVKKLISSECYTPLSETFSLQINDWSPSHDVLQSEYFYMLLAVTIYCLAYQFAYVL
jgi:hypothetical protein